MISIGKTSCLPRSALILHSFPAVSRDVVLLPLLFLSLFNKENIQSLVTWGGIGPCSASLQLLCQLPQHLVVLPSESPLCQRKITPWQDVLEACIVFAALGAIVLTSKPLGKVLGTRTGVICYPCQEAEPCLWSSPDVCPGYDPICCVLPLGPCSLLALGHCLDEVALLFHLRDLLHNHSLPLLSPGFGPELDWFSPTQPCQAVLDSSQDLFMPQPADCLVHLLLSPPPTLCADIHCCKLYHLVLGFLWFT